MPAKRGSKFGARKTLVDGTVFDSKREAKRFVELCGMLSRGEISGLETQVEFELIPKQRAPSGRCERSCKYLADFRYITAAGALVVEDVKSKATMTPSYVMKRKLLLERFGIEVREVL